MVSLYDGGIYLVNGKEIVPEKESAKLEALTGKKADKETAKNKSSTNEETKIMQKLNHP